MAKKTKKAKKAEQAKRKKELKWWLGIRQAHDLLKSELDGLYEETDKLCKKAPNEPATSLQTDITNRLIKKVKRLLDDDLIITEVTAFVTAGDNPEYRDVVTVLRQLRQGLDRGRDGYLWSMEFDDELEVLGLSSEDAEDVLSDEDEGGDNDAAEQGS